MNDTLSSTKTKPVTKISILYLNKTNMIANFSRQDKNYRLKWDSQLKNSAPATAVGVGKEEYLKTTSCKRHWPILLILGCLPLILDVCWPELDVADKSLTGCNEPTSCSLPAAAAHATRMKHETVSANSLTLIACRHPSHRASYYYKGTCSKLHWLDYIHVIAFHISSSDQCIFGEHSREPLTMGRGFLLKPDTAVIT